MARSSCYVRELPFLDNFRNDFQSSFAHLLHVDLHVEDSLGMMRGAGHALKQAVAGLVREDRRRRAVFPTRRVVTRLYMFVKALALPQERLAQSTRAQVGTRSTSTIFKFSIILQVSHADEISPHDVDSAAEY